MYRSSAGDLSYHDDPPMRGGGGGGGERWDRDRFERMRGGGGSSISGGSRRGPPGPPHGRERDVDEHYRFQEHDRFPGGRRDIDVHEDYRRAPPPTRVAERERFRDDHLFDRPSRRRNDLFEEPTPSEVANRALAPYRRTSVVEENIAVAPRRPQRPGNIRRQSSLDTFDRRPLPRYNEIERIDRIERDEWRPPVNVNIPLPIRERRQSPPRRFREEDYEEVRYRDLEREPSRRGEDEHEEFREVEVKREKSKVRRSRSRAAKSVATQSVRSSSSSSFEEVEPVQPAIGRRGKTRMPKRLVKKQAVIELGYPFEEEDDFIIVKRALEKEHIDEIIKISENYKEEKTTYVYEEKEEVIELALPPPPPPPPPAEFYIPPPPPAEFYIPPPLPPASVIHSVHSHHTQHAPAPPPPQSVHYAHSVRTVSPSRHGHEIYEERIEESNHIGGALTVLVPEERRMMRSERDIKEEIRMLESERRMLKYEREGDYEIVERREPRREVIRIDKDRKVRKGPTPKLVAAMMATLT